MLKLSRRSFKSLLLPRPLIQPRRTMASEPLRRTSDVSLFESWMVFHKKEYSGDEVGLRFKIFCENLEQVRKHNAGNSTYRLGLTKFSDMTEMEFNRLYLNSRFVDADSLKSSAEEANFVELVGGSSSVPDFVDLRLTGGIGPSKDQGAVDTCWAFSATCTVEFLHFLETGKLLTLSEQELIDCDHTHNHGCGKGSVPGAYTFMVENGGLDSDADYPYTAKDGVCDKSRVEKAYSIDGYAHVQPNNENLLKAVVSRFPVTAYIRATQSQLQQYRGGILLTKGGSYFSHAVVLVGYGTENGVDYWLAKNSFGPKWGEEGCLRIPRNTGEYGGSLGVAVHNYYPLKIGVNCSGEGKLPIAKKPQFGGCSGCKKRLEGMKSLVYGVHLEK